MAEQDTTAAQPQMDYPKMMRDIGLNDPVTIILPSQVLVGYLSAYECARWHNNDADAIAMAVIKALFDPLYIKERQAAMQEDEDRRRSFMRMVLTGRPPEEPPNVTDVHDD